MSISQYVTYITYGIFILLLLIGGKFKFRKGEYHEDSASLDVMKSLRGIAALGVLLHHVSQHENFQGSHTLSLFVNAGLFFVAIFFFCSGYGLMKSFEKKPDYLKGFIKNRIGKGIALPFYINIILYGLYFFIFAKVTWPVAQWVCNGIGLTMMNPYAWFPVVLILLYFAFFIIFKLVKNRPLAIAIMLVFVIAQGIFFCWNGHFAWWYGDKGWWMNWSNKNTIWWREEKVLWFNGEWWVNSSIAFVVGLFVAYKEVAIKKFFSKLYYLKLVGLMVLLGVGYFIAAVGQSKFGYWTEFSGDPGIKNKIVTYFSQIPEIIFLVLVIYVILMKYHATNPVLNFFGKFSLHTYLMNWVALEITPVILMKQHLFNRFIYFLPAYLIISVALSIVLGMGEFYITEGISKLLFQKKKRSSKDKKLESKKS